jgi:hypothetical protein
VDQELLKFLWLLVVVVGEMATLLDMVEMVVVEVVDWLKEHPYQFRHLPDPIQ